ncbi:DUF3426 domain-containing protein [Dichotomicrobium thermohalophilum]|uniref:Putative Zn finger-like uncharacterized protein n=1 Tax=Dichotomicrobium thermohalophilum TaxID=933063 RepID=A0A397PI00_9HYPH|nr:DUF3426 domain-containing protein [Dichotomicrobium thermohalophilum]RIA47499.1 putative Zn finger-like uncharacterized protein [Dichotomicrobium thermohalophilum]
MEFRCPACDTSYRVPVRIDQQVRCARCNHVWRIAESDFVIDEDARDETEMPEAFSSPGANDEHDSSGAQGAEQDDLSALLESGEDWMGARNDEPRAPVDEWPAGDWSTSERHTSPALGESSEIAPEPHRVEDGALAAGQAPGTLEMQDEGADAGDDSSATGGPTQEDAESFDRRLADSWFSGAADRQGDTDSLENEPNAAFERIMEGIEEVIAENSGSDDSATDRAGDEADDPLRALMNEERARSLGATLQDQQHTAQTENENSDDPWGGKVVRLTARSADRRVESRAQDEHGLRETESASSGTSGSVEPMADLIDKIATGRAEPSDLAEAQEPEDIRAEPEGAVQGADAMSQAHFEALQADMEDAAHAMQERSEPEEDGPSESWTAESYHDDAHEEAQRESLAFDTGQEAFDGREASEPQEDPYARDEESFDAQDPDDDRGQDWDEAERDRWRDEPADIFAVDTPPHRRGDDAPDAMDVEDDDALLAEYDFGDEQESETPPEGADQARRGAGTLTVAAAWALFVAVMAGAAVSAVSFRDQIAEMLPASAPVYAAIGFPVDPPPLVFGEVGYSWDETSPNTLILTGQVKNNRSELTEVPNMQITARDDSGEVVAEESQFLGQSALLPGETYDFRVQVEVSPDKLKTVELRF